tara:strand:+ start:1269 stop:2993 length:1725 start_codon:yes stop_codon:yes gene_type:complete
MSGRERSAEDAFSPASFALNVILAVSIVGFGLTAHENRGRVPAPEVTPPPLARSNIHRQDYVGPAACAECHAEKHAAWQEHPHSRMNLDAGPDSVRGDFSGVELRYAGRVVRFEREGDRFLMTISGGEERRRYRVTRTVGSRFTQMYIGVLVEGPEPAGDPAYTREGKLPFGYWFSRKAWFPESYFDSDCPPEYDAEGHLSLPPEEAHQTGWEKNCLYCHNTYAYTERLWAQAGTPGFPAEDLRLLSSAPLDEHPGLAPSELVTLGISCESCHFGGRDHARDEKPIRFLPESPHLEFPKATSERVLGAREDPYVVNSICAQCHFSRGVSLYPNGAGIWNSRESVDLSGGACASQLRCTDCHDPHQAGPPGGGPATAAHTESCYTCHAALRDTQTREDHTQHGPEVSCLDCHMPRIVQGLESVVRTHRISSPGDERMLKAGAPNACNLCHLDRSISWTAATLKIGWGQRHLPDDTWSKPYQGRVDAPVGAIWLSSSVPIHRLVAADAYSRSPFAKRELPRLIRALVDPIAVNRMFALFALERVLGRRLSVQEYQPTASPKVREGQVRELLETLPE